MFVLVSKVICLIRFTFQSSFPSNLLLPSINSDERNIAFGNIEIRKLGIEDGQICQQFIKQ